MGSCDQRVLRLCQQACLRRAQLACSSAPEADDLARRSSSALHPGRHRCSVAQHALPAATASSGHLSLVRMSYLQHTQVRMLIWHITQPMRPFGRSLSCINQLSSAKRTRGISSAAISLGRFDKRFRMLETSASPASLSSSLETWCRTRMPRRMLCASHVPLSASQASLQDLK